MGTIRGPESRSGQARRFLQSPWADLVQYLVDPDRVESQLHHGECKASASRGRGGTGGWAWANWKDGLHYEAGDSWAAAGGWSRRPRNVIPWSALRDLIAAHPCEIDQISNLAEGHGWRWFAKPYILSNWGWHPSYYEAEMDDDYYQVGHPPPPDGYVARLHAWLIAWQIADDLTIEPADLIEWAAALDTPPGLGNWETAAAGPTSTQLLRDAGPLPGVPAI